MLRRHLIAAAFVAAAVLAAPSTAAAAHPPAGYVPSPGFGVLSSARANTTNGGAMAPSYPAGGATFGTAPASQPPKPSPPKPATSAPQVRPGPGARDVPRGYLRIYRRAGKRFGVDWRVLAAIGKMESDHGRSTAAGVHSGLNFASCCSGPMQICTVASCGNVWRAYAVDGDADGSASVYDPPDAIYAAAAIIRDLQYTFGRNHPGLLLAAYNAGPAAVQRFKGVPRYPETRAYVKRGLNYMRALRRRTRHR